MTSVYEIKTLTSTIQLEISMDVFEGKKHFEFPIQRFEGFPEYNWKLRMYCQSDRIAFLAKRIKDFGCPELTATVKGTGMKFTIPETTDQGPWIGKFDYTGIFGASCTYQPPSLQRHNLKIKNGTFTLIIEATLRVPVCRTIPTFKANNASEVAIKLSVVHSPIGDPDFKFLFGPSQCLMVHKECFSNWSPVFKAMLEHDTMEARNNTLEIKDFDYDTVKAAVDLLYCRPFEPKPISQVVGMLRFAEKYLINPAVDLLENWLIKHITEHNFDAVVKYAFEHDSKKLKAICAHCYYKHMKPGLRDIDPVIISQLAHLAVNQA